MNNDEIKTPSGLVYTINHRGNGECPKIGDTVVVNYTGRLKNDEIFDSSLFRDEPFTFKLGVGQVIKGWDEGFSLLSVGDKATFVIPANLAYGSNGVGGVIGPNETLTFDVELIEVK